MSKIPVVDEVVRSVQSLGDAIVGKPDRARSRWENWTDDSFIGTAGKTVALTTAAGMAAPFSSDTAGDLISMAGRNGERLSAITLSAGSQVVGVTAQVLAHGIPNPVSGACNGFARAANKVINAMAEDKKEGIDWKKISEVAKIDVAKGAASSDGMIPYAGKAVETTIKNEEAEFDHGEEWSNWGVNVVTAAVLP